jgi:LSD1 subclass zinc finger protein
LIACRNRELWQEYLQKGRNNTDFIGNEGHKLTSHFLSFINVVSAMFGAIGGGLILYHQLTFLLYVFTSIMILKFCYDISIFQWKMFSEVPYLISSVSTKRNGNNSIQVEGKDEAKLMEEGKKDDLDGRVQGSGLSLSRPSSPIQFQQPPLTSPYVPQPFLTVVGCPACHTQLGLNPGPSMIQCPSCKTVFQSSPQPVLASVIQQPVRASVLQQPAMTPLIQQQPVLASVLQQPAMTPLIHQASGSQNAPLPQAWTCSACTLSNPGQVELCTACGRART